MKIRQLFSTSRALDRKIEKVIDYRADEEAQLAREIDEYEVTRSVERGMDRLLESLQEGARGGDVTEIGAWVSGFYGSGKSSFTKYLGFALDGGRTVRGEPFVDCLARRIPSQSVRARLKTVASKQRVAVFMVDLGTDQLSESASISVANVLYWNVLKDLGFSKEKKVADLELRLSRDGKLDAFREAYRERYPGKEPWDVIHNDPMLAVLRASTLAPRFYPDHYKDPTEFRQLVYQESEDVGELARRMIDLIKRHKKCDTIVFFIDEVGQYVAPRQELILNLDGLVRAFKQEGRGSVWVIATAQQTLEEISDKAALNSAELFKLRDRFPIKVELEATDIRDITANRLLTKNTEGTTALEQQFKVHGELLQMHTHLVDWPGGRATLDAGTFAKHYPFLPSRFDLVLSLIRALARRTGGTGLRSAIRLVQDLLVDTSRALPSGVVPLADRPVFRLAAIDDIYEALRQDIQKEHPHAVEGVQRIERHPGFRGDALAVRAAKAVAALQPLENHPRTAANIAALLYAELGAPSDETALQEVLNRLVDAREFGMVELRADANSAGGGYSFLSDEVRPYQKKRDSHEPTQSDRNIVRQQVLKSVFDPLPEARIEGTKTVYAGVRLGRSVVAGESSDIFFSLEEAPPASFSERVAALDVESQTRDEHKNVVFWVFSRPSDVDELLGDACRSEYIRAESDPRKDRDKGMAADVMSFLRSEDRRGQRAKESAKTSYQRALQKGVFVFRGRRRAVEELATTVTGGATLFLQEVASEVFRQYGLVKKNVHGDVAAQFLDTPLDRMPKERDPLGFKQEKAGRPSIATGHPALAEARRAFREQVAQSGSGRVHGSALLEYFARPPYGWSKDTTRYVFAALLVAGEVEIHSGDGVLRTAGPKAVEAMRNTQSFNRIGVAPRGQPVPLEALDRASRRLEEMFGVEVLPLEDQVSRIVRSHFPTVMEQVGSLPARLRLLGVPGKERAQTFLEMCADLLKEDAGGAASLLGSVETSIPTEARWARGVVDTLNNGGESDIMTARRLLERVGELAELFPQLSELEKHPAAVVIREIVRSDSFHQRIADLRSAEAALRKAARDLYDSEKTRLAQLSVQALKRLEAMPLWMQLTDTEREAIVGELTLIGLPDAPQDAAPPLQRVLTRILGIGALEEALADRVEALGRAALDVPRRGAPGDTSAPTSVELGPGSAPEAEPLSIEALLPEGPLASEDDVELWIRTLREKLLERIGLGPVRLIATPETSAGPKRSRSGTSGGR